MNTYWYYFYVHDDVFYDLASVFSALGYKLVEKTLERGEEVPQLLDSILKETPPDMDLPQVLKIAEEINANEVIRERLAKAIKLLEKEKNVKGLIEAYIELINIMKNIDKTVEKLLLSLRK